MEIKNLIGNKQQRYYRRQKAKYQIAGVVRCLIVCILLFLFFYGDKLVERKNASPEAFKSTIEVKANEVTTTKNKYELRGYARCYDAITCIRDIGEEMGFKNSDITTMVKIAKCESGYKANAKNPTSTATGIFQIIIGTWDGNKCLGERWDYEDNIKCGWQIYKLRGTQPWISSQGCWKI